jgi:hypothetical protein
LQRAIGMLRAVALALLGVCLFALQGCWVFAECDVGELRCSGDTVEQCVRADESEDETTDDPHWKAIENCWSYYNSSCYRGRCALADH